MALADEFGDWMTHLIDWESRERVDVHGAAVYGLSQSLQARVVQRQRMVMDATGQQRLSTVQIYLRAPAGIEVFDRITLPADIAPRQPKILNVKKTPDETGVVQETIYA